MPDKATSLCRFLHSVSCTLRQGIAEQLIDRAKHVPHKLPHGRIIAKGFIYRYGGNALLLEDHDDVRLILNIPCKTGIIADHEERDLPAMFPAILERPLKFGAVHRSGTLAG